MAKPKTKQMSVNTFIEQHISRLEKDGLKPKSIKNAVSTIKDFSIFCGKAFTDSLGVIFSDTRHINNYLEFLKKNKKSNSTLRTSKSYLANARITFLQQRSIENIPLQFGEALTYLAVKRNIKWKPLAKLVTGDETQCRKIMNWAQGRNTPRSDSINHIKKLEEVLEIPEGTLTSRLPKRIFGTKGAKTADWTKSEWAEKQAERTSKKEKIKYTAWTDDQENEFEKFFQSKLEIEYIGDDGEYYKNKKIWRIDPDNTCPTAENYKSNISHFYGFLVDFAPDHLRVDPQKLTLALLCDINRVYAWIKFAKDRAGNINNGFTEKQLIIAGMLCRPQSGYLWSNKGFQEKLNKVDQINHKSKWRKECKRAFRKYREHQSDIKKFHGGFKKTRSPQRLLAPILDKQHPIQSVLFLIKEHEKEKPGPHQTETKHAVWHRNNLIIRIELACPFRAKTLAQLTYKKNQTGTIFKQEDGSWWIDFDSPAFKNHTGGAKHGHKSMLPEDLWKDIDTYVKKYRPILLATYGKNISGVEHDLFLVNAKLNVFKKHGPPRTLRKKARSLSDSIRYLFKTYLGISAGLHAFRHIIATDWLKNNPDSYMIVANILMDSINTVMRDYAHLKQQDSMKHYHSFLKGLQTV